jgi:chemotaxis protein histidine kinase CheA/DNA-binding response OmpR family regulator
MNSQGNFPEKNDPKAQQALNNLDRIDSQDIWTEEENQTIQSGDEPKTTTQKEVVDNILAISEDEMDDSSLENFQFDDLDLLDSELDNTQDLLPFINKNNDLELNITVDNSDLDELLEIDSKSTSSKDLENLDSLILADELLVDNSSAKLSLDDEILLESSDNLDDLFAEEAIAIQEQNLNPLDLDLELSTDNELDLDNLLEEPTIANSDLDLDNLLELPFINDDNLDLDNLLEESPLGLNLELDNSLELDNLDNLLNDTAATKSLSLQSPVAFQSPPSSLESSAPAQTNAFEQTMRVSVKKLDNLNNLIGELVVKRNRLEEDQQRIRRFMDNMLSHVQSLGDMGGKMHDLYERSLLEGALIASRQQSQALSGKNRGSFLEEEKPPNDNELDALELDRFTGFHLLSQDIIELIVRVREAASDIQFVVDETDKVTQALRQVTSQLQEGMNSSRMIAFGQTTDRLPRAIRDISHQLKKQVELQVEGKDVLIDKMIVENLYNPMTHLVNNAITHGIETPEERAKLGKPITGTLSIRAFLQGNQTVIAISDDGAGIDPERVKAKAVEKNLLTWAQAQNLSKQEVYDLIFHAGFSTKDQADDFAGRGVGMDVVSTDLKKIRGTIGIESKVGKGTIFTIRLPLVLSICKAIRCIFNNTRIAFPLDGVEAQKEFSPSDIKTNENGVRHIPWNNSLLPFQPLGNLLCYNRQISRGGVYNLNKDDDTISIVILRSADHLLAVEVDQILGEQEIVIKQIEGPAPKPPGIAGATVLGDGVIMPIADVLELIEIAQGKRTIELGFNVWQDRQDKPEETVNTEPTVLVVDDSITVRELLTLSFNKLGYRVEQARDGQEGWDKLRGGLPCDMIFCDIEMPRMNGLELLSNLQKDDKLKRIPVAMLTSRGADKHRQLATDLGAQAYLTKPYTERDLMDVAQKLIEVNRANREAELMVVSSKNQSDEGGIRAKVKTDPLVLIIDDSVTVRELLSMTFKKAGYRVEKARDGQEAWEKLQDGLECDIAFCDIEMPRMNGLELLANLQQDDLLSSLPIAMLTSRGAQKMRNIAAQRGARGYFVKPYVEETLLDAAVRMMQGEVLLEQTDFDDLE